MSTVGIIRRVDELGRVVIPKELRTYFGLETGSKLEILADEGGIRLVKPAEKSTAMKRLDAFASEACFDNELATSAIQSQVMVLRELLATAERMEGE